VVVKIQVEVLSVMTLYSDAVGYLCSIGFQDKGGGIKVL
jgi:hypothetical protein